MRIAAIDIGTNSIHMVIADAIGVGAIEVVDRERDVVQIGRGSFSGHRLRREAIRRSVESLARFVQLARRLQTDRILCTATAAVREAQNGGELLQAARAASGVTPRVIPAEEEGRLIYLAVKEALQIGAAPSLIVDIGGGSVQFVVGDAEKLRLSTGAPLGALRLTELLPLSDPPTRGELERLRRHLRREARAALGRVAEFEPGRVFGSSGTIHALAQLAHWEEHGAAIPQINGYPLSLAAVDRQVKRLSRLSIAQRERLPGLDAHRAEIILPGAMVLRHVLDELGADGLIVSDFGVREGLVIDYIANHAEEVTQLAPLEDLRMRSVVQLLRKFGPSGPHPAHVARLALSLYDGFRPVHELPPETRDLLHYAALLHDVGSVVSFDGHAEHSGYIIRNGNLRGLSREEVEAIACVARYHGKGRPKKRDREFRDLRKKTRRTVRWLAALLRIAEGLDRSHYQLIRSLRVARRGERFSILVTARRDAKLELWAARRRLGLLAERIGSRKHPASVTVRLDRAADLARRATPEPKRAETPAVAPAAASPARPQPQTPARPSAPALKVVERR
ncbi:MAG TPA: Ppx/GppA phosphatase family protein [Candidatus Sulfotelmatobacter sp.]|nr:Ppx/GppA phosphatase family protein [Candidatus Sulfotelmatobacter sp.]